MEPLAAGARGSGGFVLELVTESFAVRALLGSLAAVALASLAVRIGAVRSPRARRLLILAPVLTAAAAGVATARTGRVYLPRLSFTTTPSDTAVHLLDALDTVLSVRYAGLHPLLVGYLAVVMALLLRRLLGALAVRRVLSAGGPAPAGGRLARAVVTVAPRLGVARPRLRLRLVPACPGGAFASGLRWPVLAADPALIRALDDYELEGLVAHELAHLQRRDPLVCLLVGLFRDVTFFLPPVHLARRWLAREQEESADELAALATARPAALASGILKVWHRGCPDSVRVACPAVSGNALLLTRTPRRRTPDRLVTARVERLIAGYGLVSRQRRIGELALAAAVFAAATVAAVLVPGYIAQDLETDRLGIGYLSAAEESEVFATFRLLNPGAGRVVPVATRDAPTSCPCVESQADLRARRAATASDQGVLWGSTSLRPAGQVPVAQSLWSVHERGRRFEVFRVGRYAPS